ncbi:RHS repeat domain-containing protein [Pseudomonas sp. B21-031]|jgi:RHS repeat-associated protein|uniref:RHS repeat domain-containing protein n=1 Tax=Pseudomonas TaxID=286 RepID=UPI002160047F|nr:RHS repeat-associated core domain-containing protein [Pseudomonas sp. B21-031]UVL68262.1 hypothetical protein LOY53_07180 [Pseudomonas sp. B21-031]
MIATTSTHSNAFNFLGFMQGEVDPRTGQYTLGIELPKLVANDLIGPNLPLRLDFSPLNDADSGYGIGWSINLTQYHLTSKALSLMTGENLRVTSDEAKPARISEQKLVSFEFYKDDADNYRVVHRSGMVEHLRTHDSNGQKVALPHRIYAVSGHWIDLTYIRPDNLSHLCLSEIRDATGRRLLSVEYQSLNRYNIHLNPDDGASVFTVELTARKVAKVVLPSADNASWRFEYLNDPSTQGMTCLKTVSSPTGSVETISYDNGGHLMPTGAPRPRLPKVASHSIDPGFKQPKMVTQFAFSQENFMGGNSGHRWTEGEDTLYKIPNSAAYFYTSTQTQTVDGDVVRKVTTYYNRYHLVTKQRTEQFGLVAEVLLPKGEAPPEPVKDWHIHETETVYHENPALGFALQPRHFQMAKFGIQRWRMQSDTGKLRQEVTFTDYDEHGNQTLEVQPNGIHTVSEYYPAQASDGCPADPHGFVRSLKQRTVYPAGARPSWTPPADMQSTLPKQVTVESGAPVLTTRYRYRLFDALTDASRIASIPSQYLVQDSTTLSHGLDEAEVKLEMTELGYHHAPDQPALHGRQITEERTLYNAEAKGLLASQEKVSTRWHYPGATTKKRDAPLEIKETVTCKGKQKSLISTLSSLTGDTLTQQDIHRVVTAYEYDALQRVVKKTIAAKSAYPAELTYAYQLVATTGQQASMTSTDANGVITVTAYDGLNRTISQARKTKDTEQQLVYEANHDELGQLADETAYDHHPLFTGGTLAIKTQYTYGAWGELCETLNADETRQHTAYSPFGDQGDMTASWMTGKGQPTLRQHFTLIQDNLNEKPWQVQRLDSEGEEVEQQRFFYDGLGQSTREEQRISDPLTGKELQSTSTYTYDAYGRMTQTERPDGTLMSRVFAAHSRNVLVEKLYVHPRQGVDGELACERSFDGQERMLTLVAGPRQETYEYEGKDEQGNDSEQMLMSKRTTAANRVFTFSYDTSLSLQPKTVTVGSKQPANYGYDSKTTAINSASNDEGDRSYSYTDQGYLLKETWVDKANASTYVCDHTASLQGRPLLREDSDQQTTQHGYDGMGRLSWTTQGNLRASFTYDDDGRLKLTSTQDLVSLHRIDCEQRYDCNGQEIERILTPYDDQAKGIEQRITHVWRGDGRLHSRTLLRDGKHELTETFGYDTRKRLESYLCEGDPEAFPRTAKGLSIEEQTFKFDVLDNLIECKTWFADRSRDVAIYTCKGTTLQNVTHTHNDYLASCDFSYDADGNMLNDEAGNQLIYDEHSRLKQVLDAAGEPLYSYRYDGHDHVVGVRYGTRSEVQRRYQNERLHSTVDGNVVKQYLYDGDRPLGLQAANDSGATRLLLSNMSNSVLGESHQGVLTEARYSAYGDTDQQDPDKALQGLLAFNGEVRECALGWYLLGRGARAYNPQLMRFHSPDSMPPEIAGANPYQYCLGDPVNWRDPSGRVSSRTPTNPPATGGTKAKKSSKTSLWVTLGVSIAAAVISMVPFGFTAGATLLSTAALSFSAKVWLVVGFTGVAMQVGGLAVQGIAMNEEDPEKINLLLAIGGGLSLLGATATGFAAYKLNSILAAIKGVGQWQNFKDVVNNSLKTVTGKVESLENRVTYLNRKTDVALKRSAAALDKAKAALAQRKTPGKQGIPGKNGTNGTNGKDGKDAPAPTQAQVDQGVENYFEKMQALNIGDPPSRPEELVGTTTKQVFLSTGVTPDTMR